MHGESEVYFQCPYCWQTISMVVEKYYPQQKYIEDCEVCCNPIEVSYTSKPEDEIFIEAKRLDD